MTTQQLSSRETVLLNDKQSFESKLKKRNISRLQKSFIYDKLQRIDESLKAISNRK